MNKIKCFISYSHEDQELFQHFKKGITTHSRLLSDVQWNIWNDGDLCGGQKWHEAIQQASEDCDFAILLLSANFLASKQVEETPLRQFLAQHRQDNTFLIFPVLISSYRLEQIPELIEIQQFFPAGDTYGFPGKKNLAFDFLINSPYLNDYLMDCAEILEKNLKKVLTVRVQKNASSTDAQSTPIGTPDETPEKPQRFFNIAGPIIRVDHYFIEPLERIQLDDILSLIEQKKYFVLHAPRQTGKTTYMIALMNYLNTQGNYKSLYVNIENAQAARENVDKGLKEILNVLAKMATFYLNDSFFENNIDRILNRKGELGALFDALSLWCENNAKPIVLFIDEIDSLVGDTLIAVLRQLRSGYPMRPGSFPHSIILCGVRDVRDYRIHSDISKTIITGGSAFNVKSASLKLGNFTHGEIENLYHQHTTETGQTFATDVFPLVWELTEGQPWLVNALAYEACFNIKAGQNRETEITVDIIQQAKENLILRRVTHLDQLSDKLKEERVRRVIEPILAGNQVAQKIAEDDVDYVVDLGLIKKDRQLRIANRIYQEVIPRTLTYSTQLTIPHESTWYLQENGSLHMDKLLTAFQDFFRQHFESWVDGFDYYEAGPQLLLQAFLQRIVNGGGRVEREYGLGRQRTDILVIWPYPAGLQKAVIELKLLYNNLETTIQKGLEQTWEYMDKCGTTEGYLIVIDKSPKKSWAKKIFKKEKTYHNTQLIIFGM